MSSANGHSSAGDFHRPNLVAVDAFRPRTYARDRRLPPLNPVASTT
jgi:hypothetical protein